MSAHHTDEQIQAMLAYHSLPGSYILIDRQIAAALRQVLAERDALKARFTNLDKPKYSGDPMLDAVLATPNAAFTAWTESLPATYWARYDLSAARVGWEAGQTQEQNLLQAIKETK